MPPDMVESELRARQEALKAALTRDLDEIRTNLTGVVNRYVPKGSPEFHDVFEETVSLCVTELLQKAAKYDPSRNNVVAWATGFAIRTLMTVLRTRKRYRRTQAATDVGEAWESAQASFKAYREREVAEVSEAVRLALEQMKPADRQLIELMDLKGLSYEELHAEVGGEPGRLRMAVHRARGKFAKIYERLCREEDSQ